MSTCPYSSGFIDLLETMLLKNYDMKKGMRRPGFEPGLPDWQSDVLDQTGRPSP
jgi:hypothetical protein